ncbi:hypothetical protein SynA1528_02496 [Synechococcus sp. A15-28]|nr:hypothetical protein SynA1528_02496 [Synechococcus sp. A15-28]
MGFRGYPEFPPATQNLQSLEKLERIRSASITKTSAPFSFLVPPPDR